MKANFYLIIFFGCFYVFSIPLVAQEFDPPVDTQALNEADSEPRLNDNEAKSEVLSIKEMQNLERENKAREKEALKVEKTAKMEIRAASKLERQIKKTERAEMRAQKARDQADQQTLKTREAIDHYLQDQ